MSLPTAHLGGIAAIVLAGAVVLTVNMAVISVSHSH